MSSEDDAILRDILAGIDPESVAKNHGVSIGKIISVVISAGYEYGMTGLSLKEADYKRYLQIKREIER